MMKCIVQMAILQVARASIPASFLRQRSLVYSGQTSASIGKNKFRRGKTVCMPSTTYPKFALNPNCASVYQCYEITLSDYVTFF